MLWSLRKKMFASLYIVVPGMNSKHNCIWCNILPSSQQSHDKCSMEVSLYVSLRLLGLLAPRIFCMHVAHSFWTRTSFHNSPRSLLHLHQLLPLIQKDLSLLSLVLRIQKHVPYHNFTKQFPPCLLVSHLFGICSCVVHFFHHAPWYPHCDKLTLSLLVPSYITCYK